MPSILASRQLPNRHAAARHRAGFTAIELLVVMGIMMVLASAAVPTVLGSIRRSQVNGAASDLMACWREAQFYAMTRGVPEADADGKPKHYGLMLVQGGPGERSHVAMIYDNRGASDIAADTDGAILRAEADRGRSSPAVCDVTFPRAVTVASALGAGSVASDHRVLVIYAQYRTGMPIDACAVAAGRGTSAAPSGIAMAGNAASSLPPSQISALRMQTVDYSDQAVKRGYALRLALSPIGYVSTEEL